MIKKTENEIMRNWKAYEEPLVSICCATYNHENFIAMALDSMLIQETNFPFEIIVRDDFSTDQTATVIKDYVEKFPNIISPIFETENQYSKGVKPFMPMYEKTSGKYIAILEGDDYWRDKYKLEKQVTFLDKNKDYVLSYNNSIVVNENNQLVRKIRNPLSKDYTCEEMQCGEVTISTNTVMFRKVNLALKKINKDIILWHFLGQYGKSKYQAEIIPAAYREHSGGVWSGLNIVERFKDFLNTREELKKLCHDNFKLKNRIDKSMNKFASESLCRTMSSFDFDLLQNIIKQIMHNKDLSIFKVVIKLPLVCLQRIKSKIMQIVDN